MAESFLSFVVKRLGDLLMQEANFLSGVRDEVESILAELSWMKCFLKDADSKQNGDERVCKWVAEIKDLAYDIEDSIENYAIKVASRRSREAGIQNVLKRFVCILNEGISLHKVRSEIEAITKKISNLTRRLQTYGIKDLKNIGSSSSAYQRPQLRRSYSHVVERHVVGLDKSIEILVAPFVKEKDFQVVSICGMGGLGKTTLAKKIYHHDEVRSHFDYFAWSCISQQCRTRDVWEGILTSLISPSEEQREKIMKLRDEELAKQLYQVQQEKKSLVVLDDIWNTQAWDLLRAAFPDAETSSKLLLATRNKEVALHADPTGFLYEPPFLNDKQSWELLQKIAIPQKDDADFRIDTRMEELGKQMVQHCAGLLLAITVLGGLLATKYTSNEWHMVNENIKPHLRKGKGHGQGQSGVFDVLALSYDDLPNELKPCFLYLSHFPENYEIKVEKLIQLWAAEGFITSMQHDGEEGEETVEDLGESYFIQMVERCVIQVGERDVSSKILTVGVRDASSKILTCRMHDLMRDLCLAKAKEENLFHIINCWHRDEDVDVFSSMLTSNDVHRLAVLLYGGRCEFPLKCISNPHLRSLLYLVVSSQRVWWDLHSPIFGNLKFLRVLDLERVALEDGRLPKDIGTLIRLRFLSLRYACVFKLPSSLGNLRFLQTLDLLISSSFPVYIPNVIWKMEILRHLYLPMKCTNETRLHLGTLRNLQTLVNFPSRNCDVRDLLNLTNLRNLTICHPSLIKDIGESLKPLAILLKHLRSLSLTNVCWSLDESEKIDVRQLVSGHLNLVNLTVDMPIEKLPDYLQFSPNITSIELHHCKLEQDPMRTLEKLPNLKFLLLSTNNFIGKGMVCSREGFPQLNSLSLSHLLNLEEYAI